MLDAIRKRSASILVKLLLGLLVASFAIWGMGDVFRGGISESSVASVGNIDITPQQLSDEVQREIRRLQPVLGRAIDLEQARALGLVDLVLKRLVDQALFDLGAGQLDILISDNLISTEIRKNSAFKGILGKFDRQLFQQILQNNGLSEGSYVASLRGDIARGQLIQSISSGATVSKAMSNPLYGYRQEKRIAETLYIADEKMSGLPSPDEEVLAKFHQENAQRFTAPEYRKITAVVLRASDLAKEMSVSEEQLREAFENRRDEFGQPERRHLLQMVMADEVVARRAHEMLSQGQEFAAVAKEVAGQDQAAIDFANIGRDDLLPELADAAFALGRGAYSEPLRSPLGWHLVKVLEIEAARQQSLDDVRDTLAKSIANEQAIDGLFNLANRLEDTLGGGATLQEASAQLNLKLLEIPSIDATGRSASGTQVSNLPPGTQFLTTAFETGEGQDSVMTEAGSDAYFVLRVDRVTPPTLKPLPSVRAQVVDAWKEQQRANASKIMAEKLLKTIQDAGNRDAIVTQSHALVGETKPFVRAPREPVKHLSPLLIGKLFDLPVGGAALGRADGGYTVAVLKAVRPAEPQADKSSMEAFHQQLVGAMQQDLVAQFANALRARHAVSTNAAAVKSIY